MLNVYIEYCISVKMYHVSAQGVDERTINVHYDYYYYYYYYYYVSAQGVDERMINVHYYYY